MTDARQAASPRWVELRDQQRSAVVDAVLVVVCEGATDVTVAELAHRAGMSRPTFYKYFPTVGSAMLYTERTLLAEMDGYIAECEPIADNSRELLLQRFALTFEYTCQRPEIVRFFTYFDFTFERFGFAESERAEQRQISGKAGNPLYQLFLDGQRDGSIEPTLPVDATYLALITSLVGMRQRLLIESKWTTGVDQRARDAHTTLVGVWRTALKPS